MNNKKIKNRKKDFIAILILSFIIIFVVEMEFKPKVSITSSSFIEYPVLIRGKEVMYNDIPNIDNTLERWKAKIDKGLKTAQKVYDLHDNLNLTGNYTFDEIYDEFIKILNYTTEIDDSYENEEYIQTVQELFDNDFRGDCDDYAMFFYVMAKKKGVEVRYVLGFREGSGHAWIQIKKGEQWIEYDSTSKIICDDFCISNKYNITGYI